MKKVTKGFLLKFKNIHIVLPVKFTYMTNQVRLNLATQFLKYVNNNKKEMLPLLNIQECQINSNTFDAIMMDKELCIPMSDMQFIIDLNVVKLCYRKRANLKLNILPYAFDKLRIINV